MSVARQRSYSIQCSDDWKDDIYRYRLDALTEVKSRRRLVVVQINPSQGGQKARGNILRSDPTVGKVAIWAEENGYCRVNFLNLFAFVSTPQQGLCGRSFDTLVGPRNDEFIESVVYGATTIILAWGKPVGELSNDFFEKRVAEVRGIIGRRCAFTIGPLVDGCYPRHGRTWNDPHRKDLQRFTWS